MKSSKLSVMILVVAIAACLPAIVYAATITVNDLNDNDTAGDGNCTLREAINNSNSNSDTTSSDCAAGSGVDTIDFSVSGTITLGSTLFIVDSDALTIDGTGRSIAINGNDSVRVMAVTLGARLDLNAITIQEGSAENALGGGIYNEGTLVVSNSNFLDNSADIFGGGIFNEGTLTITSSIFQFNEATDGGGIANVGTLTVINSYFGSNTALTNGGGIFNQGTLTVTGSTFDDNEVPEGEGGGISNVGSSSTVTVTNSTIFDNIAVGAGGGIYNQGTLTVSNCTISGNTAGVSGGLFNDGTLHLLNTIIANSSANTECGNVDTIATNTNNLIEDGRCNSTFSGDPMLDPAGLTDNGGPMLTIALLAGSTAIDQGDATTCTNAPVNNLDQRGFARPVDGDAVPGAICDIGAYEFSASEPKIEAFIDIKFCGNPNAFNCKKKGVLPVTIFGTDDLNVTGIDISTVQLCLASDPDECVSLMDAEFPQDRGNPDTDLGINSCLSANPDGFDDLGLLFVAREVAQLIECSTIGKGNASPTLIIKGELNDGTRFQSTPVDDIGVDQLRIVNK